MLNVSNSYFEERTAKKTQIFIIFKGLYFVMGGSIDMSVGVFWEASVG